MAKTINLRKLNAIFNEYLNSNEEIFTDFLVRNGYATQNAETNAFDFTEKATSLPEANLNFDLEKSSKYAYYLSFLAWQKQAVLANNEFISANALARTVVDQFLVHNKSLGMDEESAKYVMGRLAIGQERVKTEKSHPKLRWFLKKIVAPAAIGLVGGIGIGLGFGLAGLAIGSLPFVSESLALTLGSYTLIGGVATAIATPIVINIKDAIVKAYHKRKLNGKDTMAALNENLDSDEFSIDDLENLPVKDFLDKFLATEAKAIDRKENSKRHVKRAGTRNKLHAIIDFTKMLEQQLTQAYTILNDDTQASDQAILKFLYPNRKERKAVAQDPDITSDILKARLNNAISRREKLLTYIQHEISGDLVENFIAYKQGKDKKFRMADIFIRHGQGVKKNRDVAIVEQVVKPIYMSVLTSGFGADEDAGHGTKRNLLKLASERQQRNAVKNERTTSKQQVKEAKQQKKTDKKNEKQQKKADKKAQKQQDEVAAAIARVNNRKNGKKNTRVTPIENVKEFTDGDKTNPAFVERARQENAQRQIIKDWTEDFEKRSIEELREYCSNCLLAFSQGTLTDELRTAWLIANNVLKGKEIAEQDRLEKERREAEQAEAAHKAEEDATRKAEAERIKREKAAARAKAKYRSELEKLNIEQLNQISKKVSDEAIKDGWTTEYIEYMGIISDVIKEKEVAAAETARKADEEEAARKAEEAQKAKELLEELAEIRRQAEENARKAKEELVLRLKAGKEEAARKAAEEEAARKAEEEAARKAAEEEAARKAEEEAARKAAEEEARKKAEEEEKKSEIPAKTPAEKALDSLIKKASGNLLTEKGKSFDDGRDIKDDNPAVDNADTFLGILRGIKEAVDAGTLDELLNLTNEQIAANCKAAGLSKMRINQIIRLIDKFRAEKENENSNGNTL